MDSTLRTTFDRIYQNNGWGFASGPGSDPAHLKEYADYLNGLIRDLKITSFLDVGCGDCRLAKMLNLKHVKYIGIDVSRVALQTAASFGVPQNFLLWETTADQVPFQCDMVHVKDVLQHLPWDECAKLLADIARHKHAVVTNDIPHWPHDVVVGGYRPIDITQKPIYATSYKPDRMFQINGFTKLAFTR